MSIGEVIKEINKQNSIENLYCVRDIENEGQLNNLKNEGYLVDYTKESWEKEYPSIPAQYIYCVKCEIMPSSLIYLDMEHGIFFETHIYGKQVLALPGGRSIEDCFNMIIKEKMDAYQNKKYSRLFHGNMSEQSGHLLITLLSHLLEKEEPCEELYTAFLFVYTFVDCGIGNLSQKARNNLWACKSQSQKEDTEKRLEKFGKIITVYRGQGSKSTPEDEAMSWTTDKDTALFFATRFFDGECVLLEGTVSSNAVMEYALERDESEIIVEPKNVTVISRRHLMDLDEFKNCVLEIQNYASYHKDEKDYRKKYNFNKLLRRVLSLYERNGRNSRDHGATHSCRIVLFANTLYTMYAEKNVPKYFDREIFRNFKSVMDAAIYHDIGRTGELADSEHGKASYQIYRKENGDNAVVKFLIENHCVEDEEARKKLQQEFPEEKQEEIFQLLGILKDADALDRVRFGYGSSDYLKVKYLHDEDAFRLVGIASFMQSQSFDLWI